MRNRPCGEVPAYQLSRSPAWPGVSQKVWSTERRQAVRRLGEGRRLARLLPGAAQVGGAEDRRPEVAGLRRGQQGAAVARVEHQVADGVAQEVRAVDRPGTALRVAVEQPGALARGNHQHWRCVHESPSVKAATVQRGEAEVCASGSRRTSLRRIDTRWQRVVSGSAA
jgi:hypothetical protein